MKDFKLMMFFLFGSSLATITVIYIGLASIPYNPISLKFTEQSAIFILAPQGWGFFTRNPREIQTTIYKKINGQWENIDKPNSDPSFYLGASRTIRKIVFEKTLILGEIRDSTLWVEGDPSNLNTMIPKLKPITVYDKTPSPLLTGNFLVVKKFPLPWSWSEAYYKINMPYKCVLLNVINK